MISERPAAEWRIVITDDQGRLLHVLLTRRRPRQTGPRSPRGSEQHRSIVELQVPAPVLHALDPAVHPDWAPLIRDAARQLLRLPGQGAAEHGPGVPPGDGHRRFARAELARWIEARDRYCIGVACRRPARACDLDHLLDHAHDGLTAAENLAAECGHDHRLKHHGGWSIVQVSAGEFVWTSRAGARYPVHARPVTPPLPEPQPSADGTPRPVRPSFVHHPDDSGDTTGDTSSAWDNDPFPPPERESTPPPTRTRRPAAEDDPPPF